MKNLTNKQQATLLAIFGIILIYLLPTLGANIGTDQQTQMALLWLGALAPLGIGDIGYDWVNVIFGNKQPLADSPSDPASNPEDSQKKV